ncbi:MAG: hypothetical protein ABUL68_01900, partial [Pseudomonadota bacterium]
LSLHQATGPVDLSLSLTPSPGPATPAPRPVPATMEPPANSAPLLPEILKRDDNAKYFPQLKHF